MSVAVIIDSNAGVTTEEAKSLGLYVIPMPFYIDDELFLEGITINHETFYQKLAEGAKVHTSQPSPTEVTSLWNELLEDYDEIIHIPMSSGLSSSCASAYTYSQEDKYVGKVFVIDNQRISITQRQSAIEAKKLADKGYPAAKIAELLMKTKMDSSIYISVETMEYLKKGGRVTPAAAGIATILNIKPVLQIQGEKLDSYAKVRGMKSAKKEMLNAIKNDMNKRFAEFTKAGRIQIDFAYAGTETEEIYKFVEEFKEAFPEYKSDYVVAPLSLSVACHIGPGALAIAITRVVDEDDF